MDITIIQQSERKYYKNWYHVSIDTSDLQATIEWIEDAFPNIEILEYQALQTKIKMYRDVYGKSTTIRGFMKLSLDADNLMRFKLSV